MSIKKSIGKIKMRLLPPSSRSFHGATYDIRQDIQKLHRVQETQNLLLQELTAQNNRILDQLETLKSDIAIHDVHMKLYNDVFFRQPKESPQEMRKRLFRSLPEAEEPSRTFQLANAKLLHALEAICQEHHLDYWLWVGSLVGAASRNGIIPWDDDIDICMMREDGMKLYELLQSDPNYQVTLVYDYYAFVRQFRFSHRDPNIPCFIDIPLWDWASDTSESHQFRIRELRHQLIDSLPECRSGLTFWRDNPYLFAPGSGYVVQCGPADPSAQDQEQSRNEIEKIEKIFQKFRQTAFDEGVLCDRERASAIAFGLDNYSEDAPWRKFLWPIDKTFPTQTITFENGPSRAPRDIQFHCDECYPGWPYLPKDILGHDHFSRDLLKDPAVFAAMRSYIED